MIYSSQKNDLLEGFILGHNNWQPHRFFGSDGINFPVLSEKIPYFLIMQEIIPLNH